MTSPTRLTRAAIRAEIDTLAAKQYGLAPGEPRVVGIRDAPAAELEDEFPHTVAGRSTTVHVVPCVSALAAYEALVDRDPDAWLVLVTDRSDDDLGEGVRARLIGQRLRLIDPWLGVRTAFGATGIDRSLTRLPQDREVANGLLALISRTDTPWPAAPGGLLTLDHVAGAVAGRELGLDEQRSMRCLERQTVTDSPQGDTLGYGCMPRFWCEVPRYILHSQCADCPIAGAAHSMCP